ncbi:MAG: DIP1984 family protein, partial [Vulcanimicrobiaceae bacterium]
MHFHIGVEQICSTFFLKEVHKMKLGEALNLRSDNLRRIDDLGKRAMLSAQVQEGSKAADDASELIEHIDVLSKQTTVLIQRINRTNVATRLANGSFISDALAERDRIASFCKALRGIAKAASEQQTRYMRSELRIVRTVDTASLLKKADELSQAH